MALVGFLHVAVGVEIDEKCPVFDVNIVARKAPYRPEIYVFGWLCTIEF
jgi:hypothetical protein